MRRAAALLLALLPATAEGQEYRRLGGAEIAATLAGMEFTDETHFSYVFERGGRLTSVSLGKRGGGTWRVEGEVLCTTGGPGMVPCHQVWIAGRRLQLRRDDEAGYPEEGVLQRPTAAARR